MYVVVQLVLFECYYIQFYLVLVELFGGFKFVFMFGYVFYWMCNWMMIQVSGWDGWFWKIVVEWWDVIGFIFCEQEGVCQVLCDVGIW